MILNSHKTFIKSATALSYVHLTSTQLIRYINPASAKGMYTNFFIALEPLEIFRRKLGTLNEISSKTLLDHNCTLKPMHKLLILNFGQPLQNNFLTF